MEPPKHNYHAQSFLPFVDFHQLLATKTFLNLSYSSWEKLQKTVDHNIYRNKIGHLRQSLLFNSSAKPLHLEKGGYHDFWPYFDSIVETYKKHDAFLPSSSLLPIWNWKLSWDNRRLGQPNEAWNLSPCFVHHSQSPVHSHLLMLADIPERNIPMAKCVGESALDHFIMELSDSELSYKGEDIQQHVFPNADWIAICRQLDSPLPNTVDLSAPVCWKCGVCKYHLRTEWLQDPFHWHDSVLPISYFPNANFGEIPLCNYRYCWMHNLANAISSIITGIHDILPLHSSQRSSFHSIITTICPNWYPTKPLIPHQMKLFFSKNISSLLIPLYSTRDTNPFPWPYSPYSLLLSTSDAITMLLDSITTFFHFAYTISPLPNDFKCLRVARNAILSCYAFWNWRISPTSHYLYNHAIIDAETDGSAYHTLQEGVEHANSLDKRTYRNAFKLPHPILKHKETSSLYILNQYQLRLYFIRHFYQQAPYVLYPSSSIISYPHYLVTYPKYSLY